MTASAARLWSQHRSVRQMSATRRSVGSAFEITTLFHLTTASKFSGNATKRRTEK
jgi:hypothetical protein